MDPATDLAVVKIDGTNLPAVKFADADAAVVGSGCGDRLAVRARLTRSPPACSRKGRGSLGANEIEDYLQTDASINPATPAARW